MVVAGSPPSCNIVLPVGGIAAVKDRLIGKGYRFGTLQKPFADYYDSIYFDMAGFEGGVVALNARFKGFGRNAWSLPVIIRRISPGSTRTPAKA